MVVKKSGPAGTTVTITASAISASAATGGRTGREGELPPKRTRPDKSGSADRT